MPKLDANEAWNTYVQQELALAAPLLSAHGLVLESEQPHLHGERYLMQAVTTTSGKKLILLGKTPEGQKVVIKVTSDPLGKQELARERACAALLQQIHFAYQVFSSLNELLYVEENGCLVSVHEFIEQEMQFLDRALPQQFSLALRAFKAQESAHATTFEHHRRIQKTFGSKNSEEYLRSFVEFQTKICDSTENSQTLPGLLEQGAQALAQGAETIEQYCDFLTHTDFVPHNIRIRQDTIFLLDHSSLRFGNKYEGWARFLNFMTLYNPALEKALVGYVRDNRTPEELLSLKLMRIYRLAEIIWYYTQSLARSSGTLHTLNTKRIEFWTHALEATLQDHELSESIRSAYMHDRDILRSDDEKKRQQGLH